MSIKESNTKKNYSNVNNNMKVAKYEPGKLSKDLTRQERINKIHDDSTKNLNKILKKLKKKHPGVFHKDDKFF